MAENCPNCRAQKQEERLPLSRADIAASNTYDQLVDEVKRAIRTLRSGGRNKASKALNILKKAVDD